VSGVTPSHPGVLIVDDDRHIRDILRELFISSGYQAQVAADGREALELFDTDRPSLTVTDVHMPVMDGVELLKKARAIDPDAAFLVLTGVANVQTAVESLKFGAYDFIMKPVHMDELLIAAERALEHRGLLIERREHQEGEQHANCAWQRDLRPAHDPVVAAAGRRPARRTPPGPAR